MNRREFLKLPPSLALTGLGLTLVPVGGLAQDGQPQQFIAVQRRTLGDWTVLALSDGYLPFSIDLFQGIDPAGFESALSAARIDPQNPIGAVNAYLVDTGSQVILIDAGTGAAFGPTLGVLPQNLAAAGYAPEDIDLILVTHLHPDHIGGAISGAGAAFPQAAMSVSSTDRDFFFSDEMRGRAPEEFRPLFDLARGAVTAYGERVSLFSGEASVAPGITAVPLPGHTPGHVGFMLENGGESLLIWGDVMHLPALQMTNPEVTIAFDIDPDAARATRLALMEQVAGDNQLIAGMHMVFPGFGYLESASAGYGFVPAPWDYF